MGDINDTKPNPPKFPQPSVKAAHSRATSYPSLTLEESINLAKQLREKLGAGPYSREEVAKAFGHSTLSGPASSKIAACLQFGLIDRAGNTYSLSKLAKDIIIPTDETERAAAILEAVQSPRLYATFITKYAGSALPTMLDNIFIRDFKISDKVVKRAVADFKASLTFAGLLKDGVVLPVPTTVSSAGGIEDANTEMEPSYGVQVKRVSENTANDVVINIPGTEIKVIFPQKYAFDLSVGAFMNGLTALKGDADKLQTTQNIESETTNEAEN